MNHLRLSTTGLPAVCINDIVLLSRLGSGFTARAADYSGKFPLWMIAGWQNYLGHVTGKEFSELAVFDTDGYCSIYSRVLEHANNAHGETVILRELGELVDQFLAVRKEVIAAGEDALCLAIDAI